MILKSQGGFAFNIRIDTTLIYFCIVFNIKYELQLRHCRLWLVYGRKK